MKQTISVAKAAQVARLVELLVAIGRQGPLRDPLAMLTEQAGLTSAQVQAISWLHHDAPLTMGLLARRVGVTEKTITGIVDRLERAEFVRRERDSRDRRVVQVVLTAQGQKLAAQLHGEVEVRLGKFLQFLDAQDGSALFRILENIAAKLDVAAHSTPADSGND